MSQSGSVKIMWIVNGILIPMVLATGAWVWNTDRQVNTISTTVQQICAEGTQALRRHLIEHGAKDQQLITMQGDMKEVKVDLKGLQGQMTQMNLLLERISTKLEDTR